MPPEPELSFARLQFDGDPGRAASRDELIRQATAFGQLVADPEYHTEFGLAAAGDSRLDGDELSLPVVESIRSTRRIGPSGQIVMDLVAEVTQRRSVRANGSGPGFDFYGGATVILNPQGAVRYVVRKSVLDGERLRRQREFIISDGARFFGRAPGDTRIPESKLLLQLHDVTRPQFRAGSVARAMARDLSSPAVDRSRAHVHPAAGRQRSVGGAAQGVSQYVSVAESGARRHRRASIRRRNVPSSDCRAMRVRRWMGLSDRPRGRSPAKLLGYVPAGARRARRSRRGSNACSRTIRRRRPSAASICPALSPCMSLLMVR